LAGFLFLAHNNFPQQLSTFLIFPLFSNRNGRWAKNAPRITQKYFVSTEIIQTKPIAVGLPGTRNLNICCSGDPAKFYWNFPIYVTYLFYHKNNFFIDLLELFVFVEFSTSYIDTRRSLRAMQQAPGIQPQWQSPYFFPICRLKILWRRFLEGKKLLYKIWHPKWFFQTTCFISDLEICKHSSFF